MKHTKGKVTVKWEKDDHEEEESKQALCLLGRLWTEIHWLCFYDYHGKDMVSIAPGGNQGNNKQCFSNPILHWRDKEKVLEVEPWLFDKCMVVLKEIVDQVQPSQAAETLTHAPF